MITKEQWDRMFERAVPVVSAGIGTLSLALGIITLTRFGPLGRRVYYQDSQCLVSVRYLGQWHAIQSFVQPDNPDVLAVYSQYGPDPWNLYDFVCRNIDYKLDIGEFWAFPSEVLARGTADCEDTSNLLTSLLRCRGINAYTALGDYQGYGHAWTVQNGFVYETTYTRARPVADPTAYKPMVMFNDLEIHELYQGALEDVFHLTHNEAAKLNLMAEVLNCISV